MVLINSNSVLPIGAPLPHFVLPATDELMIDTRLIKDMVLVIVFTCNHCPYAQAYEDRLIALQKHFDGEGAQFVLICSNDAQKYPDDSFEAMKKLHDEKQFPFPYCVDRTQKIAQSFGALCTPHCFVFNHERTLAYKGCIDDNWKVPDEVRRQYLKEAIEAILKGETPNPSEHNAIGCSIKWKPGNEPPSTILPS